MCLTVPNRNCSTVNQKKFFFTAFIKSLDTAIGLNL